MHLGLVTARARADWQAKRLVQALGAVGTVETIEPSSLRLICGRADERDVLMVLAALAIWVQSRILNSPFGAVIEAIRENEQRARACGYDVERCKLIVFTLSGAISSLGGCMLALHLSIVPLDILHYQTSGMIVMMVLLGGARSFFGPFIGAATFLILEDVVSLWTPHWQIVVGAIFVAFVLFLPKGIWGTLLETLPNGRTRR